MSFSMKEVREETIRKAWEEVLESPPLYPQTLESYPLYAALEVAKKLRKKTSSWRKLNGFEGEFLTHSIYFYNDEIEGEEFHVRH
jgi:hypothetical protein